MDKSLTLFAPTPVDLDVAPVTSPFKDALRNEISLITSNMKAFLGCVVLASLGVADIATDGTGWESKGIQAALIGVVCYLFRLIIVERKAHEEKVAKLYERIIKNGKHDDEDEGDHPTSRRSRPQQ